MSKFEVWAPAAQSVEVKLGGDLHPLRPGARGWWRSEIEREPGSDYAFVLDGSDPLPDPRSEWQPNGVHGPSRVVDHDAFEWTDTAWRGPSLSGGLVYELHIGTFTPEGTFDGAIERLDHLVELGVTHVELLPVAEFPGRRGWGYDGVDLYAPHHAYGGPDGLKRLVDACHSRGLAVVLDVVYNHLGPAGNYLGRFGPYFTSKYSTPWGDAINFDDRDSPEVRAFFIDNALHWLRNYHFDALRLDAIHAIVDTSAIHILEEMAERVDELEAQLGRSLALIAESDLNDSRTITPREAGGHGMDAQWSDDFHHALHSALTGEREGYYADFGSIAGVAKALRDAFVYDGRYSAYRGRRHGRPTGTLPGSRFLGYLQNHDQIGNRAAGERSSALVSHELLKVASALVITAPFVPMLFQGEEWGASSPFQYFTDHEDPELARAVSEGRTHEFEAFGWAPEDVPDPQDPETFERSKLDWAELAETRHADLLEWHRRLIRLRRATPDLSNGRRDLVSVDYDEDERWLVVRRGAITVACNLSAGAVTVPVPAERRSSTLLTSSKDPAATNGGLELPPESVTIFST